MQDKTDPSLAKPLLDAVSLFEKLAIRYALVGGIAAMYYGRARFTDDLDFVAEFLHEKTLAAHPEVMTEFGFDPSCTYKLYHNSGIDIDLWKDEFSDDIANRAREVELAGRKVKVADPNDLAAMKLRAGRPQDDYDISELIRSAAIDEGILQGRVTAAQFVRFNDIRSRTT